MPCPCCLQSFITALKSYTLTAPAFVPLELSFQAPIAILFPLPAKLMLYPLSLPTCGPLIADPFCLHKLLLLSSNTLTCPQLVPLVSLSIELAARTFPLLDKAMSQPNWSSLLRPIIISLLKPSRVQLYAT